MKGKGKRKGRGEKPYRKGIDNENRLKKETESEARAEEKER